jgi:formate hydrogenlyase subunit 3/multisubunit Na+/H+ antiporter MnhD subunit
VTSLPVADLLLPLTPGFPAALAVLWALRPLRRGLMPLAPWAALPALLLALLPGVEGASWSTFGIMTGLRLELDEVGRIFLLAVSLLWVLVGAFAWRYHANDPHRERFFGFFVLTMAGNFGLVVAADAASFYLFFALMTFAAYGLIVHQRGDEAFRAGRVYIVLAVLGEAAVLASLFLLGAAAGGVPGFGPEMADAWASLASAGRAEWVAALVVTGFGVKAGLVPLHVWLPLAHPVAPTAASALLSGAMIKGGLLAWIRYIPPEVGLPAVGTVLVAIGAASTLYGVIVGLFQDDPKTILAYSSVSQMGFMAIATGLVILTPGPASIAILAVVIYALHHAVAKGALFLAVGVADRVPLHAEPSPPSAGRTPGIRGWTALVLAGAALPALALSGAPASTGALSKKVLKDALYELAPGLNAYLTPVLFVAGVGTTVLMARFLVRLALRIDRRKGREADRGPPSTDPTPSLRATVELIAPWALLLIAGLAGPWWFAHALSDSWGVTLPGAWTAWGTAVGPVLVGIALAGAVARRPRVLLGLQHVRIPAGDLLAPLERGIHRIGPVPIEQWVERTGRWVVHFRRSQRFAHGVAAWLADRDLMFARGRVVASIVLLLVLGLAAFFV